MTEEEYKKKAEEFFKGFPKEITEKVDQMTDGGAKVRHDELQKTVVPMIPLPHMSKATVAERLEYHYLKKRLGHY